MKIKSIVAVSLFSVMILGTSSASFASEIVGENIQSESSRLNKNEAIRLPKTAPNIQVSASYFPDANFRTWIMKNVTNGSTTLTGSQQENFAVMDLTNAGVLNLKGVEYFEGLKEFTSVGAQNTKSVNFSYNNSLRKLVIKDSGLEEIILPQYGTNLKVLDLSMSKIKKVDLSKQSLLEEIYIGDGYFQELDTSKNPKLLVIMAMRNEIDVPIDITNNLQLKEVNITGNRIGVIKNTASGKHLGLEIMLASKNRFGQSTMDFSKYPNLVNLALDDNNIQFLDTTPLTKIKNLTLGTQTASMAIELRYNKTDGYFVMMDRLLTSEAENNWDRIQFLDTKWKYDPKTSKAVYGFEKPSTYLNYYYWTTASRTDTKRRMLVRSNISMSSSVVGTISGQTYSWTKNDVLLKLTTRDKFAFNLGVEKIQLPSGVIVNDDSAEYLATSNGVKTFKMFPRSGQTPVDVSITISKIDKSRPGIKVSGFDTPWTNKPYVVNVKGTDEQSGVASVTTPSGTVKGDTGDYTVNQNGEFSFKVTDVAGNESEETVKGTKLDTTPPTFSVTGNPTAWTNKDATLKVQALDTKNESPLAYITNSKGVKVPNGVGFTEEVINVNGTYTYEAADSAGNVAKQTVTVSKIDKTAPTGTVTPNTTAFGKEVVLTVSGSDAQSGVKEIQHVNGGGAAVAGSSRTVKVTTNGVQTFRIFDNAGNSKDVTYDVKNIDVTKPTINPSLKIENATQESFDVVATGVVDAQSGIDRVQFPVWTELNGQDDILKDWSTNPKATGKNEGNGQWRFTVKREEHNYEFGKYIAHVYAYDKAGNYITATTSHIVKDMTPPVVTSTGNPTTWTNKNAEITFNYSDLHTGIKHIILPNGTQQVVNGGKGVAHISKVAATANQTMVFKAVDYYDNVTTHTVKVDKIDKDAPTVAVTGNPTTWTKGDATLNITATDAISGVKSIKKPDGTIVNSATTSFEATKNGTYDFEVTDNAGNVKKETVVVNKIDKGIPSLSVSGNPTAWTNQQVELTITGADSESGVKEIVLPDKSIVSSGTAKFKPSTNGTYVFIVRDHAGNEKTESVVVNKMDLINPTGTSKITPNTWTNKDVVVTITATDKESGVKSIQQVGGNKTVEGATGDFPIGASGTYKFIITDNANNKTEITVPVTNIDKAAPVVTITGNPTAWTNKDIVLNVSAVDVGSNVKSIKKPDGTVVNGTNTNFTVTKNGSYTFEVEDNAGNTKSEIVNVDKIDKSLPELTVTGIPTTWVNGEVELSVSATDVGSGLKEIVLPDGTVVKGPNSKFKVSQNKDYEFIARDNAGNEKKQVVKIDKIDTTKPTASIVVSPTSWTKDDVKVGITAKDSESGIKSIEDVTSSKTVTADKAEFLVSENGTYKYIITDNAGNKTEMNQKIDNIDKASPQITGVAKIENVTQDTFEIVVDGISDSQSGIDRVQFPVWTTLNGQDDIEKDWVNNPKSSGTQDKDGKWRYKVDRKDHNGEYGKYEFVVRAYDKVGNSHFISGSYELKDKVKPVISVSGNPTTWTNKSVGLTVKFSDEHSGVKTIKLADGTIKSINSKPGVENTEIVNINKNGTYVFEVIDLEGNISTASVVVSKIDKVNPTLTVKGNVTEWTKDDVTINLTAADSGSGVKSITLPDGKVITSNTASFVAKNNGTFIVKVADNAGNEYEEIVKIEKIDKVPPKGVITGGDGESWSNNHVKLDVTATDSESGMSHIVLPSGVIVKDSRASFTATENGTFTFQLVDNVGNVTKISKEVKMLDTQGPKLTVEGLPSDWTNQDVVITVKAVDDQSGFASMTLPDKRIVTEPTASYVIKFNGEYTFTTVDKLGNKSIEKIMIDKIDKSAPSQTTIKVVPR